MNAMIVDSSALPEQAVRDVLASAFDSAGQRCSAARVLFVQDDIAHRIIPMLKGAMAELTIGDPLDYATDVGPVIDEEAKKSLEAHKARMAREAKTLIDLRLPADTAKGTFVAPAAYELPSHRAAHPRGLRARSCMWCASRRPAWRGVRRPSMPPATA